MAATTTNTAATEQTGVAVSWESVEVRDRLQRPTQTVQFVDSEGEPVPSWCATRELYLEVWGELNPIAERAHLLVVARAILHHLPVPMAVAESHDARLLAETIVKETRLHGPMPNKWCGFCSPAEDIEATP